MADSNDDIAIAALDAFISEANIDQSNDGWKTQLPQPPMVEFDSDTDYFWDIETNVGNISIKLMPDIAPMHCSSTIYLARLGFYDNVVFHRVISGFMAQGGDPLGRGTGGPGYQYDGEYSPNARHDRPGLLSMANAGPGTDGSQFFITFVPTPHLNDKHAIFGEVTDGMDTVQALESKGSGSGQTTEHLEMVKTEIRTAAA